MFTLPPCWGLLTVTVHPFRVARTRGSFHTPHTLGHLRLQRLSGSSESKDTNTLICRLALRPSPWLLSHSKPVSHWPSHLTCLNHNLWFSLPTLLPLCPSTFPLPRQARSLTVIPESLSHLTSHMSADPSAQPSEIHPEGTRATTPLWAISNALPGPTEAWPQAWPSRLVSTQQLVWPLSKAKREVYMTAHICQNSRSSTLQRR